VNVTLGAQIRYQWFVTGTSLSNETPVYVYNTSLLPNGTFSWTEYAGNPVGQENASGGRFEESNIVDNDSIDSWYRTDVSGTNTVWYSRTKNPYNFSNLSETHIMTDIPTGAVFPDVILINDSYYSMSVKLLDGLIEKVEKDLTIKLSRSQGLMYLLNKIKHEGKL
jgi:hypothetical protein